LICQRCPSNAALTKIYHWLMVESQARVETACGARYMKQLLKHFSHKTQTEWTEESGWVQDELAVNWVRATA
jgi:hypothetical protein